MKVVRDLKLSTATLGTLSSDEFSRPYQTLEPVWIDGPTDVKPRAIPEGRYRVTVQWSEKHKMNVPWVLEVPGFEAVEIHPGNFPKDTLACLLIGEERFENIGVADQPDQPMITNSRHAWSTVFTAIMSAISNHEEVWIEYTNQFTGSTT